MLQGCADDQILKWNETSDIWECASDRATFTNRLDGNYTNATASFTDVDNNSDATDDIGFSIGANETWIFYMNVQYNSPTAADSQWQVTAPSGATCDVMVNDEEAGNTFTNIACGTSTGSIATNALDDEIVISGTVVNGSTPGTVMLQFRQNAASGTSTIYAGTYILGYRVDGADLAENYYTMDTPAPSPGTILSIDNQNQDIVTRSKIPYDKNLVGVVTTQPGLVIGKAAPKTGASTILVALSGRVPVKISDENGQVLPGDYLTSSSSPGLAMKATKAGPVIGQALTAQPSDGESIVTVLVKNGYFNGQNLENSAPSILAQLLENKAGLATVDSQTLPSITTDRLIAGLEIITPSLYADEIVTRNLKVQNIEGLDSLIAGLATPSAQPLTTTGFVTIHAGADEAEVKFDSEYSSTPIVTASITSGDNPTLEQLLLTSDLRYIITRRTITGFVIKLITPATQDIPFSWIAVSGQNAKTVESLPTAITNLLASPSATPKPIPPI